MQRLPAVTCASLALACAVGCALKGGGESPADVVNEYHKAIVEENLDAVMARMVSTADRAKVGSLLKMRAEGMKRGGLPPVLAEKVEGETAKVTCKFGPLEQDVDLVKENGKWKVK